MDKMSWCVSWNTTTSCIMDPMTRRHARSAGTTLLARRNALRTEGTLLILALLLCAAGHSAPESYSVHFEGDASRDMIRELRVLSDSVKLRDREPPSDNLLQRRAERDVGLFTDHLHAFGYFDARVSSAVTGEEGARAVLFSLVTGPQYTVSEVVCRVEGDSGSVRQEEPGPEVSKALAPGKPALSRAILDAEQQFHRHYLEAGHPFCELLPRDVVVDRANRTVSVTYIVRPGPQAVFGPTAIEGLADVSEETVRRMLPWREGDLCRRSVLEKARKRLQESGLFALIEITPEPGTNGPATGEMRVTLAERKHRSVGFGLDYRSDDGPGARAFWEHRNLSGLGRRLRVSGELSELEPGVEVAYDNPFFLRDDQSLSLAFKGSLLDPDPYESRSLSLSATVERRITDALRASGGLKLRFASVEQRRREEDFLLLSSPWRLSLDKRDDRLDPASGFMVTALEEPFVDVGDADVFFTRQEIGGSWYKALDAENNWVFAVRARLGSLTGDVLEDIPADTRFYAGGGGSVRGYGFEKIGPEEGGEVTGGRSLAEGSVEIRKRLTERLGLAAFLDGGAAFRSTFPDFSEDIRWGAGMGLRYYTPIGPVRLDVATPLNPRSGTDDPVQVYVSVGQAF